MGTIDNPEVGDEVFSPVTRLPWEVVGVDDSAGVTVRRRRSAYRTDKGAIDADGGFEQQTVPWSLWKKAFS